MRALRYCIVLVTAVVVIRLIFAQGDYEDQLETPVYRSTLKTALARFRDSELITSGEGHDLAPGSEGSTATPPRSRSWQRPVRRYSEPKKPLPKMYRKRPTPPAKRPVQRSADKPKGSDRTQQNNNRSTPAVKPTPPDSPSNKTFDKARQLYLKRNYEEAAKLLEKVLQETPDHLSAMRYMANCKMRQRDYDEAIKYLEKCVKAKPDNSHFYHSLGAAYRFNKQTDKAVEALKKCLQIDPDNKYARRLLDSTTKATKNTRQPDNTDNALEQRLEAARRRSQANPKDAQAQARLAGLCLRLERDYDEALKLANKATTLDPERAGYYALKASILVRLKRRDEALQAINQAVKLAPDSKAYKLMKQQLEK